ncbi:protein of unknown function (DUF2996) [Rubidibacter lacunae KORDI 51-2]|uniref:DUF2996 domain-containing protein n=1 Tax=Rubidibacter lacunae KORDI 51-2 TaxID=582515 RepID=U5DJT3_9CHRO|nr:DUF2996 domain-containing protein [Rubidibacter lacunae]ERN39945.1 protein of unknown function (DUF2996) [Rubidibacter lacunae KORDI 51-2]
MAEEAKQPTAKAAKKEKPPAIENKPLPEFAAEHLIPALRDAFRAEGIENVDLEFVEGVLPFDGADPEEDRCQYLLGNWNGGDRRFGLYFLDSNLVGNKIFTHASGGTQPSEIESFMIDERKVTLGLLVLYVMQRLNGQKWLSPN